jgi:hypothetical protein
MNQCQLPVVKPSQFSKLIFSIDFDAVPSTSTVVLLLLLHRVLQARQLAPVSQLNAQHSLGGNMIFLLVCSFRADAAQGRANKWPIR